MYCNRGTNRLNVLWIDRNGCWLFDKRFYRAFCELWLGDGDFAWCDGHRDEALDRSPLVEAIRYATNRKSALMRYLDDGRLPIHSNVSEREVRRQAGGRKNWLFVRSEDRAKANTTFVSLLASCAMHGIEPSAYLLCLLPGRSTQRLPELAPVNRRTTLTTPAVQAALYANVDRRVTLLDAAAAARRSAA